MNMKGNKYLNPDEFERIVASSKFSDLDETILMVTTNAASFLSFMNRVIMKLN